MGFCPANNANKIYIFFSKNFMPIILGMLFLVSTFFCGWIFTTRILGERRIFAVVPLALLFGINGYNFFVNIFSYFAPVKFVIWAVLGAMLIFSAIVYLKSRACEVQKISLGELTVKQVKILFLIAVAVSLAAGLVAVRALESDDLTLGHLPLAATISEGNFPVKNPSAPDHPMYYHYAPDILTASLYNITKIPPWLAYDVQTMLFGGLAFLMAFLLSFEIIKRYRSSLIAAILLLYGGGFAWLSLFEGIGPLWRKFVLSEEVLAPWRFLAAATWPRMDRVYIWIMNNHTTALGFPVMLAVIYFYLRLISGEEKRWVKFSVLTGALFGYLALSLETHFAILFAAMVVVLAMNLLAHLLRGKYRKTLLFGEGNKLYAITLIIVIIGLILALNQGGILSVSGQISSGPVVKVHRQFWQLDFDGGPAVPIWSLAALKEFGLPLLLFIPAVIFFRRNKKILFLAIIAAGAFSAPFLVSYAMRPREMFRFFGLSTPLFSFIAGLFLGEFLCRAKERLQRDGQRIVLVTIILMSLSAVIFQVFYATVSPLGDIGTINKTFFAIPPKPKEIDARAYAWIKQNTIIADRFFPAKWGKYTRYSDDFIRNTGRFTPGDATNEVVSIFPEESKLYNEIVESCSVDALRKLKINYLYFSPDFPIVDFKNKCLPKLDASSVYSEYSRNDFREIYKLKQLIEK